MYSKEAQEQMQKIANILKMRNEQVQQGTKVRVETAAQELENKKATPAAD